MNKRIYFFEGMDNCLKDSIIKDLRSLLPPQTHILKYINPPKGYEAVDYQRKNFKDMFDLLSATITESPTRCLILNRSHLGEYVYGPIYRKSNAEWVFELEEEFFSSSTIHGDLCVLILLYDSNNQKLKEREDGNSLSKVNNELDDDKLNEERQRFLEAYERTHIVSKLKFDLSDYGIPHAEVGGNIDTTRILTSITNIG